MKNEHLYGRFGDTDVVTTSSGEKWHVNPQEKNIIELHGKKGEDYVESIGSGTTNPITGHKEQWVTAAIAAVGMGMKLYGMYEAGKQASNVDTSGATQAAEKVSQVETESAWDRYMTDAGRQLSTSVGKVTGAAKQTASSLMDIFKNKEGVSEKQGFYSSGETQDTMNYATSQVRDDFKSTTSQVQDDYTYTGRTMNLSQAKELAGIEERLQSRLDEIAQVPDTFKEGFWGYSNYKVG